MRKATVLLLFGMLAVMTTLAQEKSSVTVKAAEINNGVILLTMHQTPATAQEHASFVLQCTKDMPDCAAPKPGSYTMVRLPKNYGMYDCVNVDLYAASTASESSEKIGEYCLLEK